MDDWSAEHAIVALNARGEGVSESGLAIAGALPGERVRATFADGRGELAELVDASPERIAPICRYFGRCGGCAAQHMSEGLYRAWKRDALVSALARERVAIPVSALVDAHGEGRRRATFHARFPHGAKEEIGFMRARTHDIIAIDDCPLFIPAMSRAIPAARALARDLRGLGKPLDIGASASDAGLDIDIRGAGPLDPPTTRKLVATAERLDLARVSNHGAIVVERRAPTIAIGDFRMAPPPGGFLQATARGESILTEIAIEAMAGAKRIADLFCGAGAFALRLADKREVAAFDSDGSAIEALRRAAAHEPNLRGLRAEQRDLFARPLETAELAGFDAALFDPPRAGAQAQARAFAASDLPLVVAVSCNAETFARDARVLVEGGFAAQSVTPLDQFRFSPHVEIVAVFARPHARKRRRRILG